MEHFKREVCTGYPAYEMVMECVPDCPACVREATLKEVGEWLGKKFRFRDFEFGLIRAVYSGEIDTLLKGEMPGERRIDG